MKYLLDTCVISELVKRNPNRNLVKWISNISEEYMFLSVFTFAELHKGVEKLPKGKKRNQLHSWINEDLMQRFEGKIIDFDLEIASTWGSVVAKAETTGKTLPLMDSLIAATGLTYNLTVVTQNIKDMRNSGATLFNPWDNR